VTAIQLPPEAEEGIRLFNDGYYFEAHDVLEEVWIVRSGPEKTFYQGLIQIAAGFYKVLMKNQGGARSLLKKGLEKLRTVRDLDTPLDIERLIGETEAGLAEIERLGQSHIADFDLENAPRIHRRPG
jgi:predicted metal-dependent hydrolase